MPRRTRDEYTERDLARWRAELMAILPASHPVHDPTRAFTAAELWRFEDDAERAQMGK